MKKILQIALLVLMLAALLVLAPSGAMVAQAEILELPLDAFEGLPPQESGYLSDWAYEDPSISVSIETGRYEETNYMVAHVKLASYIWRWDNNAIWFLFFLYNSMKQLVFLPEAIPFLFKAFGVINLGNIILFHVLKLLYFKSKKLSRPARAKEHIFRGTT